MTVKIRRDKDKRRDVAQADLRRLDRESDLFGGLTAAARDARRHFSGADGGDDRIEIWGRRIGRLLSAAACVGLAVYLYLTYLR